MQDILNIQAKNLALLKYLIEYFNEKIVQKNRFNTAL